MNIKKDIAFWYCIYIEPIVENIKYKIQRWCYINNISSKQNILFYLTGNYKNSNSDTLTYYAGRTYLLPPMQLSIGKVVMTKKGIGRIYEIIIDEDEIIRSIAVQMMTIDYRKSKNRLEYFSPLALTQIMVYHEPTQQYILLTPRDYVYILDENQDIAYRITKRKYATLSPEYKYNVEYIKLFNKRKGGMSVLRQLQKLGYTIQKK